MITGIIAVVILIAVLPPAISNGQTAVAVGAVVVAVLLLAIGAASRSSDRAYVNRERYWAKGGPDGAPREKTEEEKREAYRRVDAWMKEEATKKSEAAKYREIKRELFICPVCGERSNTETRMVMEDGIPKRIYPCPVCKREFKTVIK